MKKLFSIAVLSILVLLGSSFKIGGPAPVPPYTMVEIPDVPVCYAVKVICTGYLFEDNTQGWQSECIVYSPNYTSIWNMDVKYWCEEQTWVSAHVYQKLYSYSDWSYIGRLATYSSYVTNTIYNYFLSKMSFSWNHLPEATPR